MSREALEAYLSENGFDVIAVDGPKAALHLLATKPVDVLVSDFEMPEMDGLQLAVLVRQAHPSLPIFIVSGREPPSRAAGIGIAGWLRKGSSLSLLRDELLDHLQKRDKDKR